MNSNSAKLAIDPSLLKIDNFKGKFIPRDFIEALTGKLNADFKNTDREFDPKPFIHTFEAAAEELLRLKRKLQAKIEDREDQNAVVVASASQKFREYCDNLELIQKEFESLDSRLNTVGNTAIRIGEQLETINNHRIKALEAKDIIEYFFEFNEGNYSRLEHLRLSGPEGEYKAAIIARRLISISKEVDIQSTEAAKKHIEVYCENFEKTLLADFDTAYIQGNLETMAHVAKTLMDFNGGASVVSSYIAQHNFFINILKLGEKADPQAAADDTIEGLYGGQIKRLYNEIRTAVIQEWENIRRIFPNSISVMQSFIQRIFAQSIQNFLEAMLKHASDESVEEYLCALLIAYTETSQLVADLHKASQKFANAMDGRESLDAIIDRSFEDLFFPYIDKEKYITDERGWLTTQLSVSLKPFNAYLAARQKAGGRKLMPPLKQGASTASIPIPNLQAAFDFNSLAAIGADLFAATQSKDSNTKAIESHPDFTGIPSLATAAYCIRANYMSIKRCNSLSYPEERVGHISSLFKTLLENIGKKYVEVSLDILLEEQLQSDPKTGIPEFDQLMVCNIANQIAQMIQTHFQACVVPSMKNAPAMYRSIVSSKNDFLQRIETKINSIISRHLKFVATWIEGTLGKLKKTDFKPREDYNPSPTQVCEAVCGFMIYAKKNVDEKLEGPNRLTYLFELGKSLFSLIVEAMRRYPVNNPGSLVWSADITKYQATINSFQVEQLQEMFECLKEIASLLIVKAENLKSVIREGHLARLDSKVIRSYLELREDWPKLSKQVKDFFKD